MGFRSVIVATTYGIDWPGWIVEKYKDHVRFGPITASTQEAKWYSGLADLPESIQQVLIETGARGRVLMLYLHDCGGVTVCSIGRDNICWSEPGEMYFTDGIHHGDDCEHDFHYEAGKYTEEELGYLLAAKFTGTNWNTRLNAPVVWTPDKQQQAVMDELEGRIKNRELVNRHMAEEIERLRKRISELTAKKD